MGWIRRSTSAIDIESLSNISMREIVMSECSIIGIDLAKNHFHVHGANRRGRELLVENYQEQALKLHPQAEAMSHSNGSLLRCTFLGSQVSQHGTRSCTDCSSVKAICEG